MALPLPTPEEIERILRSCPDRILFEVQEGDGRLLLHYACERGEDYLVRKLLEYKPRTQLLWQDENGKSPLHLACEIGNNRIVKMLLQRHSHQQVMQKDMLGAIPLHAACRSRNLEVVRLLLEHLEVPWDGMDQEHYDQVLVRDDEFGALPIHVACQNHFSEAVELLLHREAYEQITAVYSGNGKQELAIHLAIRGSSLGAIGSMLLHVPELPLLPDDQGRLPLHWAVYYQSYPCAQRLLENQPEQQLMHADQRGQLPMHLACQSRDVCAANLFFLLHRYDPGQRSHTDNTGALPLHWAASRGNVKVVEQLLAHFRVVHSDTPSSLLFQDGHGNLPLLLACKRGCELSVKALLQYNPMEQIMHEYQDYGEKYLALHWACRFGRPEIVKILLDHEPERQMFHFDDTVDSPIHLACRRGSLKIVEMLLQHQPIKQIQCWSAKQFPMQAEHPDTEGPWQDLPLHIACEIGSTPIAKLLLQHIPEEQIMTCTPRSDDTYGEHQGLPLHRACLSGNLDIVQMLLQWDAQKQILFELENVIPMGAPLQHAVKAGSVKIAELLLQYQPEEQVQSYVDSVLPIHTAVERDDPEMLRLLLQFVPDIQVKKEAGWDWDCSFIPIYAAKSLEVAQLLMEHEPVFQATTTMEWGHPAIHTKCAEGLSDIVALLLKYSPELVMHPRYNSYWYREELPIHLACLAGSVETVRILLQHQPEAQLRFDSGTWTPVLEDEKCIDVFIALMMEGDLQEELMACLPDSKQKHDHGGVRSSTLEICSQPRGKAKPARRQFV